MTYDNIIRDPRLAGAGAARDTAMRNANAYELAKAIDTAYQRGYAAGRRDASLVARVRGWVWRTFLV